MTTPFSPYRLFPARGSGRIIDQMPYVLDAGLEPALFATIAKGKLDGTLSYFVECGTGSALLYSPHGNVKMGLDMKTQREFWKLVHAGTKLHNSGFILPDGFYESADARLELSRDDIKQYGHRMTETEALNDVVFKAEIPDDDLREAYIISAFRWFKKESNSDKGMDIFFHSIPEQAVGLPWYMDSWCVYGGVCGGNPLYIGGRIVGVAPEAQVMPPSPEEIVSFSSNGDPYRSKPVVTTHKNESNASVQADERSRGSFLERLVKGVWR